MTTGVRARVRAWVEQPAVQNTIIALIVLNAVTLGLETSRTVPMSSAALSRPQRTP